MNIDLPFLGGEWAWIILAVVCAIVAVLSYLFISVTSNVSPLKANNLLKKSKKKSPSQIKYMRRKRAKLKNQDE